MSRISLWRIDGNPPRGQFRACSTVNCLPQMQWEGRCAGCQPYRKHSASLKAPLWRANPCSSMGKVESNQPSRCASTRMRIIHTPPYFCGRCVPPLDLAVSVIVESERGGRTTV